MNIVLNWPQITWLLFVSLNTVVIIAKALRDEQPAVTVGNLVGVVLMLWVLYCGGFFMGVSP